MNELMLTTGEGVFIGIVCFIIGTFFGYSFGCLNKFKIKDTNVSKEVIEDE